MKKKMMALLLSAVTVLSAATLTGCGQKASDGDSNSADGSSGQPVELTLSLWDEAQLPTIQENVDAFNAAHEGSIKVTVEQIPWDTYWTKLDASLETKEAPDVFWMNTFTVDGQEYALPKGLDSVAVALNTGLFEKYGVELPQDGWTWDDMRSVATELKDAIAAAGGSEYPIVMELDSQPSWMNFLYQNGGSYLSEDGKTCNVALPESKDAIQQVVDLMDNGQMAPYSVLTETKGTDLFISGQAAIVFIGSWKSSVLEGSSLAQEGNVQLIQMPAMAVNNKTCMGGLGYVMAANCQHKAEAWEFMKYITGKDAMTREAEAGIDIPAYLDAQAGYVANFKNINAQVFMDASANGFAYPSKGNFDWTSSVDEAVQAAFGGVKTVDEALDQGAADAQAILDEVFG